MSGSSSTSRARGEKWLYEMPAWMTSRDLEPFPDADIRFALGSVRPVYDEMVTAAGGKDLWVVGGGDLVGQFADEGLLDEMFVCIAPVVLGTGRPLLPRRYDFELLGDRAQQGVRLCALSLRRPARRGPIALRRGSARHLFGGLLPGEGNDRPNKCRPSPTRSQARRSAPPAHRRTPVRGSRAPPVRRASGRPGRGGAVAGRPRQRRDRA